MELYHKILADYFAQNGYLDSLIDATVIVQDICYQTICRIREILDDDTLEDPECFSRIEEIVTTLEDIGLDAGSRHNFG